MTGQGGRRTGRRRSAAGRAQPIPSTTIQWRGLSAGTSKQSPTVRAAVIGAPLKGRITIATRATANTTNTNDITGVQARPCTDWHTGELFAIVNAPQTDPFPKPEAFNDAVLRACGSAFEPYTGRQAGIASRLTYNAFWPADAAWSSGDRVVHCYLTQLEDLRMTQSYKAV